MFEKMMFGLMNGYKPASKEEEVYEFDNFTMIIRPKG